MKRAGRLGMVYRYRLPASVHPRVAVGDRVAHHLLLRTCSLSTYFVVRV